MRYTILSLLVLCACTRHETAETAAPDTPAEPDEAAVDEAILEAPPSFELLDAGESPGEQLRRGFTKGSKHSLRVESEWALDALVFPAQTQVAMPPLEYQLEAVVKTVAEDGTTHVELRVANVTVKPSKGGNRALIESSKKAAATMKGVTGRFAIAPRGFIEAIDIAAPPDASVRIYDMIGQIVRALRLASLPLPEEPVGRGATWAVTQVVEHRGARMQQKATYELLSVKGSRVRARVTFEQTAPKQEFTPPGSQSALDLNELEFEGDGRGTWELGQFAPRSASETTDTVLNTTKHTPTDQFVVVSTDVTLNVQAGR